MPSWLQLLFIFDKILIATYNATLSMESSFRKYPSNDLDSEIVYGKMLLIRLSASTPLKEIVSNYDFDRSMWLGLFSS